MAIIRVSNADELDANFIGVMIPVEDIAGKYHVPGWECKHCGWVVGSKGFPPSHTCPDDGQVQKLLRESPDMSRQEAREVVEGLHDIKNGKTFPIDTLFDED